VTVCLASTVLSVSGQAKTDTSVQVATGCYGCCPSRAFFAMPDAADRMRCSDVFSRRAPCWVRSTVNHCFFLCHGLGSLAGCSNTCTCADLRAFILTNLRTHKSSGQVATRWPDAYRSARSPRLAPKPTSLKPQTPTLRDEFTPGKRRLVAASPTGALLQRCSFAPVCCRPRS